MKKYQIAFLLLVTLFSCKEKELKEATVKNQVLIEEAQLRDEALEDLFETMNVIEENLAQISRIETAMPLEEGEMPTTSQKERIAESINLINNILNKNNEEIEALNAKLKKSSYNNSSLRKLISRLKEENKEKTTKIIELNEKISTLNIEIRGLQGEVYELAESLDVLTVENQNKMAEIEKQLKEKNQAYYIVGSQKELKERQIISRSGGFIGIGRTSTLSSEFDSEMFTTIDIREITFIPIDAKKIELITSHPNGSFEIVGEEGAYEGVRITEPELFWIASKYLVISIK